MFALTSKSYADGAEIPIRFAHTSVVGGKNISPEFSWNEPPIASKSFALSIVDPHPVAGNWVHWLVINMPFNQRRIVEGASGTQSLPAGAKELMNSFGERGYGGPAPPHSSGKHPYVATVYALNVEHLDLGISSKLRQFEQAIEGKVIEEVKLTGYYER